MRPTRAEIDLDAVQHNVTTLRRLVSPAEVLAVVKADGYGHGAVQVAQAALKGGATRLGVALVEEGRALRDAGIRAPVLVLSEPRPTQMPEVAANGLAVALYTREGIEAAAAAVSARRRPVGVHLKVDTGMARVGAHPDDVVDLARAIGDRGELVLEGVWTHCATADEPDNPFTAEQLDRFDAVLDDLESAGLRPALAHAANAAAAIVHPRSRYDLVRCGIAIYGIPPSPALEAEVDLDPAMRLVSEVRFVKRVPPGTGLSYGHRHVTTRETTVATVPVGYADGIRRDLGLAGGEVLIRDRRHPIVGVVTMDQLLVDCGDHDVAVGDEVVLLGRQGDAEITANDVAGLLGTIGYEVVCAVGARVPRVYG